MKNGQWLEFDNSDHMHLITQPRTEFLGFDGSYTQLERAGHMSRDDITIGSQTLANAIHQLATREDGEARAQNFMTVNVMFPEAIRLINVGDFVARSYVGGARIQDGENLMDQIHAWGQLSEAMFHMDAFPQEGPVVRQWGIPRIVEMMGIALHFCYRRPPRMVREITTLQDEDGGGEQCYVGLPLLEVFSVRIFDDNDNVDARQIYGITTVTDALRTQLIYNRSKRQPEYIHPTRGVLLTGPSEAISALGDFTIKFLLYDKARDDEVILDEEINWNFYDIDNVYDMLISKEVDIDGGSLSIHYAVFRNALAAKLKIQKYLGGENESEVYGRVSSSTSWDGGETTTLLFNRESTDYVRVRRGDLIPLSRSVAAVPLSNSTFDVTSKLYDRNLISDEVLADCTISFEPKISGSDITDIEEGDSETLMIVDWVRAF